MADDFDTLTDHQGRAIRLTVERWQHILEHPEMVDQREKMTQTVNDPDFVVVTAKDDTVHVYQRLYESTPVTRKYMTVAVKLLDEDAFILTAFFTSRLKRGRIIWQR